MISYDDLWVLCLLKNKEKPIKKKKKIENKEKVICATLVHRWYRPIW